jgi:hypothetical protein
METTTITVYAIAWGGKFIGTGQQGEAFLTVTDAQGNVVAGVQNQPITQGGSSDGSGNTGLIMAQYLWGTPPNNSGAFSYTFSFTPAAPMQLTFTVDVFHYKKRVATASNQQMVWPGLTLSGAASVLVIVPGLLTNMVLPNPPQPLQFTTGQANLIQVNVYMMCGCEINNINWLGTNFNVQCRISDAGGAHTQVITLGWKGDALYTGYWTPTRTGNVTLQSFVVETVNGNTAYSDPVPGVISNP